MKENPRILLVDDDQTLLVLGEKILTQAGFKVCTAPDGEAALSALLRFDPNIILLDVMMPKLDGFSVLNRIRQLPHGGNTPVLMLTGLDDLASIEKAYNLGATDFVMKPVNWTILKHRLRYVHRSRLTMQQLVDTMESLRVNERRLSKAQDLAKIGDWHFDCDYHRLICSPMIYDMLGKPINFNQESILPFFEFIPKEDLEKAKQLFYKAIDEGSYINFEFEFKNALQQEKIVILEADFGNLKERHVVSGIVQDITERRKAENEIKTLAYSDQVTGLHNRKFFVENCHLALNHVETQNTLTVMVIIGVLGVERISNSFSQETAHRFLKILAERLVDKLNHCDKANFSEMSHSINPSSIGKNTFGFVLSHLEDLEECKRMIKSIHDAMSTTLSVQDIDIVPNLYCGASIYKKDGFEPVELVESSEIAAGIAKSSEQKLVFFDRTMRESVAERVLLETRLHTAVEQEALTIFMQPKLCLATKKINGVEFLLRWHDPEMGNITPDRFIPIAEETGLIIPIGHWLIKKAFQQAAEWYQRGDVPLTIAINLSARNFYDETLLETIEQCILEFKVPKHCIEIEITERVLLDDIEKTRSTIERFKALNMSVAVDDFGTGYSSLGYIHKLPIDTLKVDRSFIQEIDTDRDSLAITKAVIALASSLDMKVVAEGVEKVEQLGLLQDLGCDEIQGFLLSRPLDKEAFMASYDKHHCLEDPALLSWVKGAQPFRVAK